MEQRDVLTVRFPKDVLARAKALKEEKESLNDLVVNAVDRELRRRQGFRAHQEIVRIAKRIREEHGLLPDSVPMIRALREGEGRRE